MRQGKLIIEKKRMFKTGDMCFDKEVKIPVIIVSVQGEIIHVQNRVTGDPGKTRVEDLVDLSIQDAREDDTFFELSPEQQSYVFTSESRGQFYFFTKNDLRLDIAVAHVLAKNVAMQSLVSSVETLGDAYGMYVAQQKSINEPAKKFGDWFFNISI